VILSFPSSPSSPLVLAAPMTSSLSFSDRFSTNYRSRFVFSPRLDNLGMSFCSIRALLDADSSLANDTYKPHLNRQNRITNWCRNIRMVTLFDHEEIGSQSAHGAASNMLHSVIKRITNGVKTEAAIAKSLLVSADMAHACSQSLSIRLC
jgi:aspartyl aminopeptidase